MKRYYIVSFEWEVNCKWHYMTKYYADEGQARNEYARAKDCVSLWNVDLYDRVLNDRQVDEILGKLLKEYGWTYLDINGMNNNFFFISD